MMLFVHMSLPFFYLPSLSGFAKVHRNFKVTKRTKAQRYGNVLDPIILFE